MPPAFVLSQDQTLKFVSHADRHDPEGPQTERHEFQGADTCTCQTYGYVRTCPNRQCVSKAGTLRHRLVTGIRSLKIPGPGAVAHMSLHLNQQCQRAIQQKRRTTDAPRLLPGTRCPSKIGDRWKGRRNRLLPFGGLAYMEGSRFGQHHFAILFQSRVKSADFCGFCSCFGCA